MSDQNTVQSCKSVIQNATKNCQIGTKGAEKAVSVSKFQDLDKIQHVISLVLNQGDEQEEEEDERIINLKTEGMSCNTETVYVKHEKFDSDGESMAEETLEDASGVAEEDIEDVSVAEEIVQRVSADNILHEERASVKGALPLSLKFVPNTHRPRRSQIRFKVIGDGVESYLTTDQEDYQLLKDDPRNRMHFVKYVKLENKTVKIWECGICGKEFRHQYTLMRHLPTHTDERNFKCEACGKAFRQMSTLSQHRAIHSDARPYVCELCKKTFNRVSTLISHRKTHSEHKPHKCTVCGKGFHQKGNLRNHIFTHTNERPYKCELCGKGFNQMSNLMCHKAHSHGNKTPFICNICNIEFPRKYALRSHEEYKHGIKYRGGMRIQELDPANFREIVNRKQKRREEKNLRIIHLPNGDRTLADIKVINDLLPPGYRDGRQRERLLGAGNLGNHKDHCDGVVIDPINTRAMSAAKRDGQTPFALLKPARGIPVLVKVMAAPNNKQMLVPATAEDLKSAGKITVSPNFSLGNPNNGNIKAVQIKVPVVATVIQRVAADGQLSIEVEPPGPEQDLGYEQEFDGGFDSEDVDDPEVNQNAHDAPTLSGLGPKVQYVREDGSLIPDEELEELGSVNLLAATAVDIDIPAKNSKTSKNVSPRTVQPPETHNDDISAEQGLLELASTGEIQFVRSSGDGLYEVLTQEEAAQIMQQPGQTIEIVDNGQEMQQEIVSDSTNDSLVNQNNLSALVDAIRAAGYQVTEDQKQIVITPSEQEMAPNDSGSGVQHIVYGEADEVMLSGEHNNSDGLVMEPNDAPIHFVLEETGGMISEALEVVSSTTI